ncbi:MAG: arginine repressor [Clostridia bacterium]|nr:arginine repressor [Clostridia bacterium]
MKTERQKAILHIIEQDIVETQESILEALKNAGFSATQATVSRDIRELGLVKTHDKNGRYRYERATQSEEGASTEKLYTMLNDAVREIDYAGNIVVVKCLPGTAGAVCAAADSMRLPAVVGSLAGDDTLLLVVRSVEQASALVQTLRTFSNE